MQSPESAGRDALVERLRSLVAEAYVEGYSAGLYDRNPWVGCIDERRRWAESESRADLRAALAEGD